MGAKKLKNTNDIVFEKAVAFLKSRKEVKFLNAKEVLRIYKKDFEGDTTLSIEKIESYALSCTEEHLVNEYTEYFFEYLARQSDRELEKKSKSYWSNLEDITSEISFAEAGPETEDSVSYFMNWAPVLAPYYTYKEMRENLLDGKDFLSKRSETYGKSRLRKFSAFGSEFIDLIGELDHSLIQNKDFKKKIASKNFWDELVILKIDLLEYLTSEQDLSTNDILEIFKSFGIGSLRLLTEYEKLVDTSDGYKKGVKRGLLYQVLFTFLEFKDEKESGLREELKELLQPVSENLYSEDADYHDIYLKICKHSDRKELDNLILTILNKKHSLYRRLIVLRSTFLRELDEFVDHSNDYTTAIFHHNTNFTKIKYKNIDYTFNLRAGDIIRCMCEESPDYIDQTIVLSEKYDSKRLKDIFGKHKIWGTSFFEGDGEGNFRVNIGRKAE